MRFKTAGACASVLACVLPLPAAGADVASASLPALPPISVPPITVPVVKVTVPPVKVTAPAVKVTVAPVKITTPAVKVTVPPVKVTTPEVKVTVPPVKVTTPAVKITTPAVKVPVVAAKPPPVKATIPPIEVSTPSVKATSGLSSTTGAAGGSGVSVGSPTSRRTLTGASSPAGGAGLTLPSGLVGYGPQSAPAGGPTDGAPPRNGSTGHPGRSPLMTVVRRLDGCLGQLPDRVRLVLELRAGIDSSRALSRRAVAAYLNLRVGQVTRMERRGLRELRRAARSPGCTAEASRLPGLFTLTSFSPAAYTADSALGGVKAVRYGKSPSREHRGASRHGGALGLGLPAMTARGAILAIMVALAGALAVALLFADGLGLGPRHRRWRRRWMRRPPWT
jgi:hypothetical protein